MSFGGLLRVKLSPPPPPPLLLTFQKSGFICFNESPLKLTENAFHFILLRKSVDWFLYDNGLRHERVKSACPQDI